MPKVIIEKTKGLYQATADSNNKALNLSSGLCLGTEAITAGVDAAAAAAATTIDTDTSLALASQVGANTDAFYLPSPTDVPDGKIYHIGAVQALELRTKGAGTTISTLRGVNATNAAGASAGSVGAEMAMAAGTAVIVIKSGANAWAVIGAAAAPDST